MEEGFDYAPTPVVLQELSAGQFASRWQRAVRLWWLLRSLYGNPSSWQSQLPDPFRYGDLRARLFAASHGTADQAAAETLSAGCRGGRCICQRSLRDLLLEADPTLDWVGWQAGMERYTGLPETVWQAAETMLPFAIGHRSMRDDLKALVEQGWLKSSGRGQFSCLPPANWPPLGNEVRRQTADSAGLSAAEIGELLSTLEAIAFVQPNLEVLISRLWEQVTSPTRAYREQAGERERRIFIHLDRTYAVTAE